MIPRLKGFQAWSKRKRVLNAKVAGQTAHELGRAHEWTSDEARAAGRKGGIKRWQNAKKRKLDRDLENKS